MICNLGVVGSNPTRGSRKDAEKLLFFESKLGKYQSGQMGQTVNLLSFDFGGSNPSLPTFLRLERSLVFCGSSSVDRALAFQAEGRGFEPRLPLFTKKTVRNPHGLFLYTCFSPSSAATPRAATPAPPSPRQSTGTPSSTPAVPPPRSRSSPGSGHGVPPPSGFRNQPPAPVSAPATNVSEPRSAYPHFFHSHPGPLRSTPRYCER